jgi:hypothetical protein
MGNKTDLIPKVSKTGEKLGREIPKSIQDEFIRLWRSEPLHFSFMLLDLEHQLFNCGETHRVKDGWFTHLLGVLSEISKLNIKEFMQQRQHYDLHPIDWNKTECTPSLENYEQLDFMQFRLSSSTGRVHGYFVENTFYILWLDPHHNLMPDQRFGGPKFYKAPQSPYNALESEYQKLKDQYDSLYSLIDEMTGS